MDWRAKIKTPREFPLGRLTLSRRDRMMVARHEMPGIGRKTIRAVGHGLMELRRPPLNDGFMGVQRRSNAKWQSAVRVTPHTVPYGTDVSGGRFQAFHAWLPSFSPFGTKTKTAISQAADSTLANVPKINAQDVAPASSVPLERSPSRLARPIFATRSRVDSFPFSAASAIFCSA
jgi:hypothetical protein